MIYRFLFLFFLQCFFGQNLRAYYQFDYFPNASAKNQASELMLLTLQNETSVYQSQKQLELDSLFIKGFEESQKMGIQMDVSQLFSKRVVHSNKIIVNLPKKKLVYKDVLGGQASFSYSETPNYQWKIETETQQFENYKLQKATTHFGGRDWEAWFCNEIPFAVGPYKFFGLPGLIVKVSDTQKLFSWVLKGLYQKELEAYKENLMEYQGFKNNEVSKAQFLKMQTTFRENLSYNYMEMFPTVQKDAEFMKKMKDYDDKEIAFWKGYDFKIEWE